MKNKTSHCTKKSCCAKTSCFTIENPHLVEKKIKEELFLNFKIMARMDRGILLTEDAEELAIRYQLCRDELRAIGNSIRNKEAMKELQVKFEKPVLLLAHQKGWFELCKCTFDTLHKITKMISCHAGKDKSSLVNELKTNFNEFIEEHQYFVERMEGLIKDLERAFKIFEGDCVHENN